jgi:hypothetical protein
MVMPMYWHTHVISVNTVGFGEGKPFKNLQCFAYSLKHRLIAYKLSCSKQKRKDGVLQKNDMFFKQTLIA